MSTVITEPGVYDMPADEYHADPVPGRSLSASGARLLLPPNCPARYRWNADNPRPSTAEFDFGHAAHRRVLGAGPTVVVIDAEDWRTKAAKEQRAAAHAAGDVPLLQGEHEQVEAMAAALRAHPVASALLSDGQPEQSLFWTDRDIWRRARLDWLPAGRGPRMLVADYKTCRSASPDAIERALYEYGYHQQAAWYLDAVLALGLAADAAFLFIFQEKAAPYLVTVAEPDAMALRIGRAANTRAIDIYRQCTATGHWPGYSDDVAQVGVPRWAEARYFEETE